MRCRKARSLLSAACSEELGARQHAAVREHVASCPSCKREYAVYASLREATRELPAEPLSDDFNARLLNRIAEERFAETRTRAYLPKRAPRFGWRSLVPVAVVATLLAVVVINFDRVESPTALFESDATLPIHMDDSYLTVQPVANPNLAAVNTRDDRILDRQLARTERMDQISQRLTSNQLFVNRLTSGPTVRGPVSRPAPGVLFEIQGPIYRIYRVGNTTGGGEGDQAY